MSVASDAQVDGPTGEYHPAQGTSVAILFLGVLLNLFDRQVINVLAPDIRSELRLTDTMLGLLTGTAFGLFYAIVGLAAGRLADRLDRRRLIAAMIGLWSVSTLFCAAAANYPMLALGRMGVGLGEGGAQAAGTALVADIVPPARRSSALSLMLVGTPLGMFLAYLVGGLTAQAWGWRAAFVVAGVPGLVVAALVFGFVRDPHTEARTPVARFEGTSFAAIADVARRPRMGLLALALTASMFVAYVANAWIPVFFVRAHALTTAGIGIYGAFGVGMGGAAGAIGAGLLCDRIRRWTPYAESWVMMGATAFGIPWLILMVAASDTRLALAAMAMFQISAFAWLAPTARLIQDAAGPAHRALAVAFCGAFGSIFTLCIGVPAVGLVSDLLAPRSAGAHSIGYALCLLAVPVALAGVVANARILRQLRDIDRREERIAL